MSQPTAPRPSAASDPEPVDAAPPAEGAEADSVAEPLNRAARRAKARKAEPSHVGPREEQQRQVRGAKARTKRTR